MFFSPFLIFSFEHKNSDETPPEYVLQQIIDNQTTSKYPIYDNLPSDIWGLGCIFCKVLYFSSSLFTVTFTPKVHYESIQQTFESISTEDQFSNNGLQRYKQLTTKKDKLLRNYSNSSKSNNFNNDTNNLSRISNDNKFRGSYHSKSHHAQAMEPLKKGLISKLGNFNEMNEVIRICMMLTPNNRISSSNLLERLNLIIKELSVKLQEKSSINTLKTENHKQNVNVKIRYGSPLSATYKRTESDLDPLKESVLHNKNIKPIPLKYEEIGTRIQNKFKQILNNIGTGGQNNDASSSQIGDLKSEFAEKKNQKLKELKDKKLNNDDFFWNTDLSKINNKSDKLAEMKSFINNTGIKPAFSRIDSVNTTRVGSAQTMADRISNLKAPTEISPEIYDVNLPHAKKFKNLEKLYEIIDLEKRNDKSEEKYRKKENITILESYQTNDADFPVSSKNTKKSVSPVNLKSDYKRAGNYFEVKHDAFNTIDSSFKSSISTLIEHKPQLYSKQKAESKLNFSSTSYLKYPQDFLNETKSTTNQNRNVKTNIAYDFGCIDSCSSAIAEENAYTKINSDLNEITAFLNKISNDD